MVLPVWGYGCFDTCEGGIFSFGLLRIAPDGNPFLLLLVPLPFWLPSSALLWVLYFTVAFFIRKMTQKISDSISTTGGLTGRGWKGYFLIILVAVLMNIPVVLHEQRVKQQKENITALLSDPNLRACTIEEEKAFTSTSPCRSEFGGIVIPDDYPNP